MLGKIIAYICLFFFIRQLLRLLSGKNKVTTWHDAWQEKPQDQDQNTIEAEYKVVDKE